MCRPGRTSCEMLAVSRSRVSGLIGTEPPPVRSVACGRQPYGYLVVVYNVLPVCRLPQVRTADSAAGAGRVRSYGRQDRRGGPCRRPLPITRPAPSRTGHVSRHGLRPPPHGCSGPFWLVLSDVSRVTSFRKAGISFTLLNDGNDARAAGRDRGGEEPE